MAELRLEGWDALMEKLLQLGDKASKVENKALKAGAEVLQPAISARAPRSSSPRQPKPGSQSWRTGKHAADNIKIGNVQTVEEIKTISVGVQKSDNSKYFYLKFHEWGTSKMSARPFMGPVASEKQAAVFDAMREEIRKGVGL